MSTLPAGIDLAPLDSISEAEQVALLGACFGLSVDPQRYHWKNVDGVWGSSHGVVAVDSAGPAAILLCLPWRVHAGGTHTVSRIVDGGTLERARRRGLFQAMVTKWVDEQRAAGRPLAFGVANDASAAGCAKAGADVVAVGHAYSLAVPAGLRAARLTMTSVAEAGSTYPPAADATAVSTAWTPEALVWRFDPRSGYEYRAAVLDEADSPTAIVYRVETKRPARVLVRVLGWGTERAQAQLLASVARSERTPVVLDVAARTRPPRINRGRSWLCTWALDGAGDAPPSDPDSWSPTLADLEAVI